MFYDVDDTQLQSINNLFDKYLFKCLDNNLYRIYSLPLYSKQNNIIVSYLLSSRDDNIKIPCNCFAFEQNNNINVKKKTIVRVTIHRVETFKVISQRSEPIKT